MGVFPGMVVADARAQLPQLLIRDEPEAMAARVLKSLAVYCIRYTPVVAVDQDEGLLFDISGCTHLWGGESSYLTAISTRFKELSYHIRVGIADTVGLAWALSRFGSGNEIVGAAESRSRMGLLPPAALRIDPESVDRLNRLGLKSIRQFWSFPREALRRRFGQAILDRLDQAEGRKPEWLEPVLSPPEYEERLPCLEPIRTRNGIEIAMDRLLQTLCERLQGEGKGLRQLLFSGFGIDGEYSSIRVGTLRPSASPIHLRKMLGEQLEKFEPGAGIELFSMVPSQLEPLHTGQHKLWSDSASLAGQELSEMMDRIAGRLGPNRIRRFRQAEHHWPENAIEEIPVLENEEAINWRRGLMRPLHLFKTPEPVQVTAPIPDYPPMLFHFRGRLHRIRKADGPERIETEWWLQEGEHRDYYAVEDEEGKRYWLFRTGHYDPEKNNQWFLHGLFG